MPHIPDSIIDATARACVQAIQKREQEREQQRQSHATLLDRLHTAEARVAILESQVASAAADIDDAVDRFKRLGEQLALQGAELFALRSFKASVPWDDVRATIVCARHANSLHFLPSSPLIQPIPQVLF